MNFITYALIPIAVTAVFALLAKLIPFQPPPEIPDEERESLVQRYRWVDAAFLPVFFVSAGLLTLFWSWLLNLLGEWRLSQLPPSVYLITPEPYWVFWMLPGLFLGIITSAVPMTLAMRLVLGKQRYAEYLLASQLRTRFDFRKATYLFFIGTGLLVGVVVVLGLDWYTRFGEKEIAVNRLLGFGETVYSYNDVTGLVEATHLKAPNGNIVERTRWFILFKDGDRWCNEDLGSRPANFAERDAALRKFVAEKTGKSWQHVKFVDDVTP